MPLRRWFSSVCATLLIVPGTALAAPLIIDGATPAQTQCPGAIANTGTSCTYGGEHTFDYVDIRNGGTLNVASFDGVNPFTTGNLVVKATAFDPTLAFTIRVDATSRINAKGVGYQGKLCDNGPGPSYAPLAGGRGGCAVRDSGGGGGHFGRGGRGTKDCFIFGSATTCQFPQEWEEACGFLNMAGTACVNSTEPGFATCWGSDPTPTNLVTGAGNALPDVAGQAYWHHILDVEFGAAGGDKGCRDGDGFGVNDRRSGHGGGRVVLFGATAAENGVVDIAGRIIADGRRGCSAQNDSAGGGAGGTVLVIGDFVNVAPTARVSAHGGRGGDSQPKCLTCPTPGVQGPCQSGQLCTAYVEPASGLSYNLCGPCNCTPCTSNADCDFPGQTCKNLGGALGNVCADAANQCTPYDVGDNESECAGTQNSGTCDDCAGGGGGGIINVQSRVASIHPSAIFDVRGGNGGICPICAGEAGGGAGELQLDSAYVGEICDGYDNDFNGVVDDGLPMLTCDGGVMIESCLMGLPQECPIDPLTCQVPATDARPRFALILDSSGSMLNDLAGFPTFGDGSVDFPGVDTDSDANATAGDNSRLFIAKNAVANVLAAFPENDYALARYYQDVGVDRSCQTASNFECALACCSYDDPTNNTAPSYPSHYPQNQCIMNDLYPGAGYSFPNPGNTSNLEIGWMTPTADCINYAGSCGPPERGAQYLVGFGSTLSDYFMWLDGAETAFLPDVTEGDHCAGGDCELRGTGPTPLAGSLQATEAFLAPIATCDEALACRTYAAILLTDGAESCQGDPIAAADSLRFSVPGYEIKTYVIGFSVDPADEPQLNAIALAGGTDAGQFTGGPDAAFFVQNESDLANAIATIIAGSQVFEVCNDLDDDCDGLIDEDFPDKGLPCNDGGLGVCMGTGIIQCTADGSGTECVIDMPGQLPGTEVCNGLDDNCNGLVDEGLNCSSCVPTLEVCNGLDDDCDLNVDEEPDVSTNDPTIGVDCGTLTPPNDVTENTKCKLGVMTCINGAPFCIGFVGPTEEICNGLDDDCDGVADDFAECPGQNACVEGVCVAPCSSGEFKCPSGFVCVEGFCLPINCEEVECPDGQRCVDGQCIPSMGTGGGGGEGGQGEGGQAEGGTGTGGEPTGAGGTAAAPGVGGLGADEDDAYGLASGGGGCRCDVAGGPATHGWLLFGLSALAFTLGWRRRRRPGLSGALPVRSAGGHSLPIWSGVVALLGGASTGCNDEAYCFTCGGESTGGAGGGASAGAGGEGGDGIGGFGGTILTGGTGGGCNADVANDVENCGECGNVCNLANAFSKCEQGQCGIASCAPGYYDVDLEPETGCEYLCTSPVITPEVCDGIDNDCDGFVDSDDVELLPPPNLCDTTPNTPCEGTQAVCNGATGWACEYGSGVETDQGFVVLVETLCDGQDGNCNGLVDESFLTLGTPCDDGQPGVCKDFGLEACDPNNALTTACDYALGPGPLPAGPELCNGLDDDCNNLVDDAIPFATVPIPDAASPAFFIDPYEASRTDATAVSAGVASGIACSAPGVVPWTSVSWTSAKAACEARGPKYRLCTAAELAQACQGSPATTYPYGDLFGPDTCNGYEHDGISGGADDDVLLTTGAMASCETPTGLLDLSGNATEWSSTKTGETGTMPNYDIYQLHGGSYLSPALGLSCVIGFAPRAAQNAILPNIGFRCCADP